MGINSQGWLTWADRRAGPADKIYSEANAVTGYVPHSAVGYYPGWLSRLDSRERLPNGRYTDYAAASVHGFILFDGTVIQHYPFSASCWASGNRYANTHFVAFETEGGYPDNNQPLTHQQMMSHVRIIHELRSWKGWVPRRPANAGDGTATLYEHRECVQLWGGGATACPSNRFAPIWGRILEELHEMTLSEELEALRREYEAFKTFTIAVVQGQAAFDQYTTAVFRRHILDGHAQDSATLFADMENARDDVHEAAEALD